MLSRFLGSALAVLGVFAAGALAAPPAEASVAGRRAPVLGGPPSLATPLPGNSLAVANGRAPNNAAHDRDSDQDGLPDRDEDRNQNGRVDRGETDPFDADSDDDQASDGVERALQTDPRDPHDYPAIPEPLFFDLVRPLSGRRGELEVNVLTTLPLARGGRTPTLAPEIEYVVADGIALEGELGFDATAAGPLGYGKIGGQFTFSTSPVGAHAVQVLVEHGHGASHGTLLYVGGRTLGRGGVSVLGMTGLRGGPQGASALANGNLFVGLSRGWTAGLEVVTATPFLGGNGLRPPVVTALPQVHWAPATAWKVQFGLGGTTGDRRPSGVAALRVSVEFGR